MKQCPKCQGIELYDDEVMRCPYCNTSLVPYVRQPRGGTRTRAVHAEAPVRPNTTSRETRQENEPEFENRSGRRYNYRGIVVSATPSSRFMSSIVKWFNAVFRGRPFQIGNPVHETILRIEEITDSRIPDQMRSLVYYGELGELNVGDDVSIRAARQNGRLVVKELFINDIESEIRPHGVVSAAAIRIVTLLTIAVVAFLLASIISFFTTGGIWRVMSALVGGAASLAYMAFVTLAPVLGLIFVYWIMFGKHR